tara:strand:+ start:231 stop:1004 length:774 start_codon:yes stop_codon:yes gene_type:complete
MNIKDIRLSFSSLKQFSKSPAHFVGYKRKIFKQSAPMRRGWLAHLLTLEPEKISELTVLDVSTRANKLYKEAAAVHEKGAEGVFTIKEVIEAQLLANAVKQHPLANKLISEAVEVEQHLFWSMEGVKFHGFADVIGKDYIADLKVTDNEPRKMQRWVLDNLYQMQLAMYKEAVFKDQIDKPIPKCYLITVDPNSPNGVVVYELSSEMVSDGLKQAQLEVVMFKAWYNEWDGESMPKSYDYYERDNEPMILELPNWYK